MPALSIFFGIAIYIYFFDNKKHRTPHFHAEYGDFEAIFSIESGLLIEGFLPQKQSKFVVKWLEIHREELVSNWELAVNGKSIFKIEPLR
jgi:hypothetical protein